MMPQSRTAHTKAQSQPKASGVARIMREDRVSCRCLGAGSLRSAGKTLNDLRDQQQKAARDQRQLPGNQEEQDAKHKRHADVDNHAGEHDERRAHPPGLGGQRIEQFARIVSVVVALAHTEQLMKNTAADAVAGKSRL
jgi:hypothetical protein